MCWFSSFHSLFWQKWGKICPFHSLFWQKQGKNCPFHSLFWQILKKNQKKQKKPAFWWVFLSVFFGFFLVVFFGWVFLGHLCKKKRKRNIWAKIFVQSLKKSEKSSFSIKNHEWSPKKVRKLKKSGPKNVWKKQF